MTSYYNEVDKHAAAWLRELVKAGHIADGIVDERDIQDVLPSDLAGFTQCHFFAGIGVWSYALRKAGWPDDRPVWTGSCPCQPFSAAGKGAGEADERHLWPAFFHLIEQRKPASVFGEQVASADGLVWLDLVRADLERAGYAFGAADLCAAGVGAPHIRQRLYWCGVGLADTSGAGLEGLNAGALGHKRPTAQRGGGAGRLADAEGARKRPEPALSRTGLRAGCGGKSVPHGCEVSASNERPGPTDGFWRDADWLFCRDGKWRPVEPGSFPLVDGAAARVVRLRGYGNAINAVQAKAFIEAFMGYQQQVSA